MSDQPSVSKKRDLHRVLPDNRYRSFSDIKHESISLKDLVMEALEKERMKGTVDQWARPSIHPVSTEYEPGVEDQTEGSPKPDFQHPKTKIEPPTSASKNDSKGHISLKSLAGLEPLEVKRDATNEVPEPPREFPEDKLKGKVNKEDKGGAEMNESSDLTDILRSAFKSMLKKGIVKKGNSIGTAHHSDESNGKNVPSPTPKYSSLNVQRMGGIPDREATIQLMSSPIVKKLSKKFKNKFEITQVSKTPKGIFVVGVFLDGKEYIGKGKDVSTAFASAIQKSNTDDVSSKKIFSPVMDI